MDQIILDYIPIIHPFIHLLFDTYLQRSVMFRNVANLMGETDIK